MTLGDFSQQAAAYGHSRPRYPDELVDALLADAGVSAGDPVVDIGAGTGIFTALLAARKLRVNAIEPNQKMRNQGLGLPGTTWLDATFEETTLPDASQKWAVAAQAFHWADVGRTLPEIRRILQPRCAFTVLWNDRMNDRSPVLAWVQEAISRHVPEFDHNYRTRDWKTILLSTGDFSEVSYRRAEHTVEMSRQRFLDLWRSHNQLNTIAGPERFEGFFSDLTQHLDSSGADVIAVPYACEAWTAKSV